MFSLLKRLLIVAVLWPWHMHAESLVISRAEYLDRVSAVWHGQIIAVLACFPFEHQTASTKWIDSFPKPYQVAPVDDDWYYEMCAIRGFEKHGTGMTAAQLGEQWLENSCGSWGSSQQALLNLQRGVKAPDCGHPRYNRLWFTIGPQFSADVYGALAPGLPNVAGRMAREYGHVNGYAEAVDGAVFMAAMVSLGFAEMDPRTIVRKAALMIDRSSPYRRCLDEIIDQADAGKGFEAIVAAIEDRWHIEYPATNNAVANGGITAASIWFGEGDFWKTVNLAARAADFTDADCNAANTAAVIGAMHGMKALPAELVAKFADRIAGDQMGGVKLTPPVDERITELARRTAVVGEKVISEHGGRIDGEQISIPKQEPRTQPAERFTLSDLMQYWNPEWTLERAGFGGAGGGMTGIRGITYLSGDTLATYPRDETRGLVLRRKAKLGAQPGLTFQVGSAPARAWELSVYADNQKLIQQLVTGGSGTDLNWQQIQVDLAPFANQEVTLRLYQRVLIPVKLPGNAYWKNIELK
jgi:hypothetical protein